MILACITIIIVLIYYLLFLRKLHSSFFIVKGYFLERFHTVSCNYQVYNVNRLMVVAHPDDELIFGGAELFRKRGWKVVCVTNATSCSENIFGSVGSDVRRNEFISVMNYFKYPYEIWDFEDNYFNDNWDMQILEIQLRRLFGERKYKKIVTHNLSGEYGHIQHKKLANIIYQIGPENLYVFDYDESKINKFVHHIYKLSSFYKSQKRAFKRYYNYIIHQSTKKISTI
ncbi:MAG: PIG-L family deacetylase [Thermoplasmata archaeon]